MDLFAQAAGTPDEAKHFSFTVGLGLVLLITSGIPMLVAVHRGRPMLGLLIAILGLPIGFLLGCFGGLPYSVLATMIVLIISSVRDAKRKR